MLAQPGALYVVEPNNGGLAFARRLVREGLAPQLVLAPDIAWMRASRGTSAHLVDEPAPEGYERVLAAHAGGPGFVITGSDRGTEFLASRRAVLPAELQTFEGPGSGHAELLGKDTSYAIAEAAGVRVPWERDAATEAELDDIADGAPYPCVLKPVLSHVFRAQFGEERVFLVRNAREARERAAAPLAAGLAMMLSEYVPGGDDAVEEAIVVRAADGSYPVAFGCRKIRQYPSGFGAASLCVSDPIDASMELAKAVLDEAGFTGVAGVETKHHAETGEVFFIEANVRLPTQWGLGDASGADASRRLLRTLAGEDVGPAPRQQPGVRLVFPELEARSTLGALRAAPAGARPGIVRDRLRSYRGVRELGLLNPRDPGPLALRVGSVLRSRLRG